MVPMGLGSPGESTFFRRYPTYTSTTLVSTPNSCPQTRERRRSRDSTRRGCLDMNSSSSYSRAVSSISRSPRRTSRVAVFTSRSETLSTSSPSVRLRSARTRARSSSISKGLVRVVGVAVQAVDLVQGGVAGGQHDHGHPAARLPQRLQDGDPVQPWQHDVQQDQTRPEPANLLQTRGAVVGAPHVEAEAFEFGLDEACYGAVVLHQQDARPGLHLLLVLANAILRPQHRGRL